VTSLIVGIMLAFLAAMTWQQSRYHDIRRNAAQDLQNPLYPSATFHVVTFLRVNEGDETLERLGQLRGELESGGEAKMVYAGCVAFVALESKQLPNVDWDAVIVVQYPSRENYDSVAKGSAYQASLGAFAQTYSHGMRRSAALNLALHQILLGMRVRQRITRAPSHFPFVPAPPEEAFAPDGADREARVARLDAMRPLGEDSVVIVNLIQSGTPEQQAADRAYGAKMLGMMAEAACGPMHMAEAVTVEGDAKFDNVAIVYYPGIDFMTDMIASAFFGGISGGKQLGDTISAPTIPVLSRL
jgi:hypothetical protein